MSGKAAMHARQQQRSPTYSFFFFSNNAHILLRVMSCMAEVHEVLGTTVELQTEQIKACKMCG